MSSTQKGAVDLGWGAGSGTEQVVALKSAPESHWMVRSLSPGGSSSGGEIGGEGPTAAPKKVFAHLCKNNPYIGFFHYSPRWVKGLSSYMREVTAAAVRPSIQPHHLICRNFKYRFNKGTQP